TISLLICCTARSPPFLPYRHSQSPIASVDGNRCSPNCANTACSAANSRTSSNRRPPACSSHTSGRTYSLAAYPRPDPGGPNNWSTRPQIPLARPHSSTTTSPARLVNRSLLSSSLIGSKVCCSLLIADHLVGVLLDR